MTIAQRLIAGTNGISFVSPVETAEIIFANLAINRSQLLSNAPTGQGKESHIRFLFSFYISLFLTAPFIESIWFMSYNLH